MSTVSGTLGQAKKNGYLAIGRGTKGIGMEENYEEPYEFQDAKRHSRYLGWGVALVGFSYSMYDGVMANHATGKVLLLAGINFIFFYGLTFATVYFLYFVVPVCFPPKDGDNNGPSKKTQQPQNEIFLSPQSSQKHHEMTSNQGRVRLVNRLVTLDSLLLHYHQEVQQARQRGLLQTVTVNEITRATGAKKWSPGNPAKQLLDELVTANFIDCNGGWTDEGNAYSLPHPPKTAPTGADTTGGNRWQPVANHLQPVGEG